MEPDREGHEQPRVALVTGANRGLGLAIAHGLATKGMHVVLAARDEAAATAEADVLTGKGLQASAHQLDITDPASVARAVADIANQLGRLDVLVNNAAIAIDRGQPAAGPDFEKVTATLNTNLVGAWRCCAAAIPEMRKHAAHPMRPPTHPSGSPHSPMTGQPADCFTSGSPSTGSRVPRGVTRPAAPPGI